MRHLFKMYPNKSIEPRMFGTGYARPTSDTDTTAPCRAEDGYEERALLYSAEGDSTCQQEMESSMSLDCISNGIELCRVTLTLATRSIELPGPKSPTSDKDSFTHYIIRIRMTSVISEKTEVSITFLSE